MPSGSEGLDQTQRTRPPGATLALSLERDHCLHTPCGHNVGDYSGERGPVVTYGGSLPVSTAWGRQVQYLWQRCCWGMMWRAASA